MATDGHVLGILPIGVDILQYAPKTVQVVPMIQNTHIRQEAGHCLILAAVGRDLQTYCNKLDIDLDAFAGAVGLVPTAFSKFDTYISLDRFCRMMKAISVSTADDAFGLNYGLYYRPGGTGPYGLGLRAAPTFRDMLDFYMRYAAIVAHSETFEATIGKKSFSMEWQYSPLIQHQDQFSDFSICSALRVFSSFAGRPVLPLHGQLKRSPPQNKLLYQEHFTKNITYGASTNRLHFPADLLTLENPAGNSSAFSYLSHQCDVIIDRISQKKDILTLVAEDLTRHMGHKVCSIGAVARRIGMSERTLQRRLADAGTDFTRLFDDTRNSVSLHFLLETEKPLSEVARLLGYGSQSAYARAVKRIHGRSPRQIRQEHS